MDELQKKIVDYVEANGKTYQQIALEIHEKPEVSNYEFFASKRLADQIKSVGFEVEMPAAGHRTGFAASYKSGKPGPVMVFLAEYDALVGLGHGCGHNLFGATSSLAAAALKSVIDEVGGEVRLYGTPGEEGGENGSAKGSFVREGYFKDVADRYRVLGESVPRGSSTGKRDQCPGCPDPDIQLHQCASPAPE